MLAKIGFWQSWSELNISVMLPFCLNPMGGYLAAKHDFRSSSMSFGNFNSVTLKLYTTHAKLSQKVRNQRLSNTMLDNMSNAYALFLKNLPLIFFTEFVLSVSSFRQA